MIEWLSQFSSHVLNIGSQGNPTDLVAVFIVAALIEFGIPFPLVLDSLLFLLGYQITSLWFIAIIVILVLLIGRVAGASGVYWLSRSLGHPIVLWLDKRFPWLSNFLRRISQKIKSKTPLTVFLARLGAKTPLVASTATLGLGSPLTVTLARLTPGLLSATSIASGAFGFRFKHFVIGVGIFSILSDVASIALGAVTGYGLRQFSITPSTWMVLIAIVINFAVVIAIQRWLARRNFRRTAGA